MTEDETKAEVAEDKVEEKAKPAAKGKGKKEAAK